MLGSSPGQTGVFLRAQSGEASALRELLAGGSDPDEVFNHPTHGLWHPLLSIIH